MFALQRTSWKDGGNPSSDGTGFNQGQSTGSAGSGTPVENRPPYFALAYIMRVK
jgi:hypothetical protein